MLHPGDELGGGVPIPASSQIILLYDGFTASFNTPEWEHLHPTLFQSVELVPFKSAPGAPGWELLGTALCRIARHMVLTIYTMHGIYRSMNIDPATLFSAVTHDTRLRSLLLLLEHDELCVCELTHAIGAAQPHMSRHLGHLREVGLVVDRRAGLWIHYRINPDLPAWVFDVLTATAAGVGGQEPHVGDRATLETMPNRPGAALCA